MTRNEVVDRCKYLYDLCIDVIKFKRYDDDWQESESTLSYAGDNFTILNDVSCTKLLITVDSMTQQYEYSSFEEALEAVDGFMRDFEQ
jgi:hypothetical protein